MTTDIEKVAEAIDDDALFEQMANDAPPAQDEPTEPVVADPEPQAEAPAPVAQQPIEQTPRQEVHRVPLAELLDEREKRKAYEARVAEYERKEREREQAAKAQQAPDWFENPDEAFSVRAQRAIDPAMERLQQLEAQIAYQNEQMSRWQAEQQYGSETVQKAYAELEGMVKSNPQAAQYDYQRIMSSPHKWGALVEWHQQQEAIRAYRDPKAVEERFLSDPAFLQRALERAQAQARTQPPVVSIPTAKRSAALPSVSQMGAAAPIGGADAGEDDDALFERMASQRKR